MQRDWDVQSYNYMSDVIASESKDRSLPKSGLKVCSWTVILVRERY